MTRIPVGIVLRQVFDEKAVPANHLVEKLGVSKQSVYNNFKRTDMSNDELLRWADALGVSVQEINERRSGVSKTETASDKGDIYLQQHLTNLEQQFKELAEQLRIKDRQMELQLAMKDKQIDGLQRTVDVLLGKYDLSESTTCDVIPLNYRTAV